MNNVPVDLVVVGAGPAGMAAACQARAQGLTVVVLDEQPALGGQIYRRIESAPEAIQHILGADYVAGRALAREFKASGAIHITGAVVWNVAASGKSITSPMAIMKTSSASMSYWPAAPWSDHSPSKAGRYLV